MSKIEQTVRNNTRTQQLLAWSERVSPPGFDGVTLRETGRNFLLRLQVGKLNVRSAAVTYNLLMAIPPTLLILFSLVPYLPLQNVQQAIVETVPLVVNNPSLSKSMQTIIVDFMNTERGDLLSFGILLTAFFSSNGMMGLMRSFDEQTPVYRPRKGLARRLTAIKLTFCFNGHCAAYTGCIAGPGSRIGSAFHSFCALFLFVAGSSSPADCIACFCKYFYCLHLRAFPETKASFCFAWFGMRYHTLPDGHRNLLLSGG